MSFPIVNAQMSKELRHMTYCIVYGKGARWQGCRRIDLRTPLIVIELCDYIMSIGRWLPAFWVVLLYYVS